GISPYARSPGAAAAGRTAAPRCRSHTAAQAWRSMPLCDRDCARPRSSARPTHRGIAIGDVAHAETMPLHRGRRTIVVQTRITRNGGRLAAAVTQTQMALEGDE